MREEEGILSRAGLYSSSGRNTVVKPADLVHKRELDFPSKQKEALRPALPVSRVTITFVDCLPKNSVGALEMQS